MVREDLVARRGGNYKLRPSNSMKTTLVKDLTYGDPYQATRMVKAYQISPYRYYKLFLEVLPWRDWCCDYTFSFKILEDLWANPLCEDVTHSEPNLIIKSKRAFSRVYGRDNNIISDEVGSKVLFMVDTVVRNDCSCNTVWIRIRYNCSCCGDESAAVDVPFVIVNQ